VAASFNPKSGSFIQKGVRNDEQEMDIRTIHIGGDNRVIGRMCQTSASTRTGTCSCSGTRTSSETRTRTCPVSVTGSHTCPAGDNLQMAYGQHVG